MNGRIKLIGTFIKEVGFPVFVATYLLLQLATIRPVLDDLRETLRDIRSSQQQIVVLLGGGRR